jgi:holo-[acyl-carrier protein] synthase
MLGIDVVDVARFEQAVARGGERLKARLFTARELAYCARKRRPGPHLAARFAAKEAVIKALGGRGAWRYALIEVTRGPDGRPGIELHGAVRRLARGATLEVSLTHDGNVAAAVVMIAKKGRGR